MTQPLFKTNLIENSCADYLIPGFIQLDKKGKNVSTEKAIFILSKHGKRMSFSLNIPSSDKTIQQLQLKSGEIIFVLGANGTGKSSLMFHFNQQNPGRARKISAHRQTSMNSDSLDMTPSKKVQIEQNIQNADQNYYSRYRDIYAAQRASMTICELIDAENARARAITAECDADNMDQAAKKSAEIVAPITVINELLQQSNIPIKVTIRANEKVMASKNGGPEYSVAELSDGERNALLIAGNILTAPPGTLLIIDEPERHLHRSIISPLLNQLFERRPDCGFVISTHDYNLPLERPESRILLLRSCSFNGQQVTSWKVDELNAGNMIDDALKQDLLGARRKILFVEGTESSLDKPLYSLVFPMVSVIPKGNCYEVERAVEGTRAVEGLHWLKVFGIVDSDGFDAGQITNKQGHGVYATPYYSVEAIYYHPEIIRKIASRQASISGDNSTQLKELAIKAGVAAIEKDTNHLSKKSAKKACRNSIYEQLPNDEELCNGGNIQIKNRWSAIHKTRTQELKGAVANCNWETILRLCPVRESNALSEITKKLNFRSRQKYEKAVRHLLAEDPAALKFVRNLFKDLSKQILD